jgi:hypothetical protein
VSLNSPFAATLFSLLSKLDADIAALDATGLPTG